MYHTVHLFLCSSPNTYAILGRTYFLCGILEKCQYWHKNTLEKCHTMKEFIISFDSPWKQTRITTSGTRLCQYFQSKRCIKRYIFFCQNFLPCKAGVYLGGQSLNMDEIADFCDNPLISSFQLEKIIFPVGNIFFSNWALFRPNCPIVTFGHYDTFQCLFCFVKNIYFIVLYRMKSNVIFTNLFK